MVITDSSPSEPSDVSVLSALLDVLSFAELSGLLAASSFAELSGLLAVSSFSELSGLLAVSPFAELSVLLAASLFTEPSAEASPFCSEDTSDTDDVSLLVLSDFLEELQPAEKAAISTHARNREIFLFIMVHSSYYNT